MLWIEKGRLKADGPAERVIAKYESFAEASGSEADPAWSARSSHCLRECL